MDYDNTNRGAIWKNEDKESDTHPDFKGQLNIDGVEFWVSAWKRKPDASDKAPALSFSIKPKEAQQPKRGSKPANRQPAPSDDIPFANPYRGRIIHVV
jgi:hypothetical protein